MRCMRPPCAIQPAEPLLQSVNTGDLGNQRVKVDVGSHLNALRGHYKYVSFLSVLPI